MSEDNLTLQQPASRPWGIDLTVLATIFAALIAFFGNLAVTAMQARGQLEFETIKNRNQMEMEEKKHQSALVDKAIDNEDLETTKKLFKFYLETCLLTDLDGRIDKYLKDDKNIPTRPSKGAISFYSHSLAGSSYSVGQNIYVMGIIDGLKGQYKGRIFQPEGYENQDISSNQDFKNQCNARFPSCNNGCWAGGDTGGFYGYR